MSSMRSSTVLLPDQTGELLRSFLYKEFVVAGAAGEEFRAVEFFPDRAG